MRIFDTKSMFQFVKKTVMVLGIECSRQVEKCQNADFTFVYSGRSSNSQLLEGRVSAPG